MKTIFRALVVLPLLLPLLGGAVGAVDLRPPAPKPAPAIVQAPTVPVDGWSGFYAGVNAGWGWEDATAFGTKADGFVGGAQLGYNYQLLGPLVVGVEADIGGATIKDKSAAGKNSVPWLGTARARVGAAWNDFLFYGTGGLAYGEVKSRHGLLSADDLNYGWVAGVGVEYRFANRWLARAEWLHVDLDVDTIGTSHRGEIGRLGVGYKF